VSHGKGKGHHHKKGAQDTPLSGFDREMLAQLVEFMPEGDLQLVEAMTIWLARLDGALRRVEERVSVLEGRLDAMDRVLAGGR
jgi:hypothetical protein